LALRAGSTTHPPSQRPSGRRGRKRRSSPLRTTNPVSEMGSAIVPQVPDRTAPTAVGGAFTTLTSMLAGSDSAVAFYLPVMIMEPDICRLLLSASRRAEAGTGGTGPVPLRALYRRQGACGNEQHDLAPSRRRLWLQHTQSEQERSGLETRMSTTTRCAATAASWTADPPSSPPLGNFHHSRSPQRQSWRWRDPGKVRGNTLCRCSTERHFRRRGLVRQCSGHPLDSWGAQRGLLLVVWLPRWCLPVPIWVPSSTVPRNRSVSAFPRRQRPRCLRPCRTCRYRRPSTPRPAATGQRMIPAPKPTRSCWSSGRRWRKRRRTPSAWRRCARL